MAMGTQTRGVNIVTVNDSAGQGCRLLLPDPRDTAPAPLIIWSHPHAATHTSISFATKYFVNPLVWACAQEGWGFITSNMHGDQWGNATAQTDIANAKLLAATYRTPSAVILAGASMGGLATANAVLHDTVTGVVGAIVMDAVLDLSAFYTANATYQASIRAAYGIAADGSDLAAKIAGYNPMAAAASNFTDIPWMILDSPTDTTVDSVANAAAWTTKIAAAPEVTRIQHIGAHLDATGIQPRQMVEFIKRAVA